MRKLSIATILMLSSIMFAVLAAKPRAGGADTLKEKRLQAVVHVNFAAAERHGMGLKNIANMLNAVEDAATIEVVCHGPGIGLLVKDQSKHAEQIETLRKRGVRFAACENTLREKKIAKESLLPGVETVPSGAVEVIRKQQEGFGYFRP